jgi:phosphoglycerate kinase
MKYFSTQISKKISECVVVLRVGLDVSKEEWKSNPRIPVAAQAIRDARRRARAVVVLSHRGRPDLQDSASVEKYTLKPLASVLSKQCKCDVGFEPSLEQGAIRERVASLQKGGVVLLENTRLFEGEKDNRVALGRFWASLGDVYVNDAFSVSHRNEASLVAVTKCIPSYVGIHLEQELKVLSGVMKKATAPLVVLLGGAKISDKVGLIRHFVDHADVILTGGALATTLMAARGIPVGDSLYEKEALEVAREWAWHEKVMLPIDVVRHKSAILDIGQGTVERYRDIVADAGTIIWNGPLGYIEEKQYTKGTLQLATAIAKSKAHSVVGGGETTSFLVSKKLDRKMSFVSTGGGAMLCYLGGEKLPALKALG